jgi:hypothetical protein
MPYHAWKCSSCPGNVVITGVRYVSLNPVRARLVARAEDRPWSSVKAHLSGCDDGLVTVKPVLDRVPDFVRLLAMGQSDDAAFAALRLSEQSGRPLANADFIEGLERLLGRRIARRAPGGARRVSKRLRSANYRLRIRVRCRPILFNVRYHTGPEQALSSGPTI